MSLTKIDKHKEYIEYNGYMITIDYGGDEINTDIFKTINSCKIVKNNEKEYTFYPSIQCILYQEIQLDNYYYNYLPKSEKDLNKIFKPIHETNKLLENSMEYSFLTYGWKSKIDEKIKQNIINENKEILFYTNINKEIKNALSSQQIVEYKYITLKGTLNIKGEMFRKKLHTSCDVFIFINGNQESSLKDFNLPCGKSYATKNINNSVFILNKNINTLTIQLKSLNGETASRHEENGEFKLKIEYIPDIGAVINAINSQNDIINKQNDIINSLIEISNI